uniref:Ubiquitin carboxyl-terminal hydrolase 40 n=1 Tax=Pelodiscus sinensis TaxID=13735 RepID=K7FU66_PELSI|nr:ubiquitin carboxyl-terminal hydrolase 40 isoform X1 [Pelodiscus sinensis]|eukprot:XP_014429374.1 ubiquitin carboxyl-terminal hydrolase 40 isoform X1 [Pelodiscus sinensis]
MFGDLFEEDFSFVSNNQCGKGKKSKSKDTETPAPREFTNLSGIKNQGGTCYLNSLLQTLHFTPEFREALFSLGPEELGSLEDINKPDVKVRIIPLQLQRLFAQLLLLDQQAASTTDLTESFGWNSNEEMRQHDVQELNRILFSALETSLVGTSGHDLINRLYHGTVVNQIVCKECKNVSERQEDFLDLTVAVKDVSGLEEALWNMYVEEEYFENDNLYRCGACNKLVEAAKSAKLRKLPPFLTVSLLRFNFDFEKCERYKEMSCYTFPIRINLRPFCEQTHLDDSEYIYELFSVIIHKGGCYGGHYHVYIKDVDALGNWQLKEEESKLMSKEKDQKETENVKEMENPLTVLKEILSEEESKQIPVDQLGQKLLEKKGVSWNKKYRKQYGPIRKYLQNHSQIFLLSPDENKVSLKEMYHKLQFGSDSQGQGLQSPSQDSDVQWTSESLCTVLKDNTSGSHWFDLNDSKVQPIKEKDIEKQFQGKESAYMLFYRKSQLKRPPEAQANPRYRVPDHLLNEMDAANIELHKRRMDCDSADYNIDLHLHLGSHYKLYNGALHPSLSRKDSVLDLTIDKRKTLGDVRQSIFQLLEFWEGDMILSIAKSLPAGLHLYQTLDGDEMTLAGIGLADGADVFVWNGKEVGGMEVLPGLDHEPVLLNVLRLAGYNEGGRGQHFRESQHVIPSSAELSTLWKALASPGGIILKNSSGSDRELENWKVICEEDMKSTVRSVGLADGSSILVLDSHDQSLVNMASGNLTAFTHDISWLQVKNFCRLEAEEKQVKITATVETVMSDIKIKAIQELQLGEDLVDASCLRPVNESGKLLSPVPEDYTVKEAELKMGSLLGLCHGKAPTSTQLFLYFVVASDLQGGHEMEIVVEESASARECLNLMLDKSGLSGDSWHLRRIDWCYEAGEALSEEGATLKELNVCSGDTLVITEGKLPPKGFLKVPIWWFKPLMHFGHQESMQDQVNGMMGTLRVSPAGDSPTYVQSDIGLCYAGDIEISAEAFLEDLKIQAMTLPSFQKLSVPSPEFLRAWTLESKHPGKLLRNNQQQLNEHKLGGRTEICLEPLQKEENLSPSDLLLRVQMGIPGERDYYHPVDLVWDISKECTAWALRQRLAVHYALPVEKIRIAKYFPEKFEWMTISSWTQQISKKKRKKKQESLQSAPYHLKDGDIIGVKNLLLEDGKDFSTVRDDIGKETQRQRAMEKKKSRQAQRLQNNVSSEGKVVNKHHKPEVALSINVGIFR